MLARHCLLCVFPFALENDEMLMVEVNKLYYKLGWGRSHCQSFTSSRKCSWVDVQHTSANRSWNEPATFNSSATPSSACTPNGQMGSARTVARYCLPENRQQPQQAHPQGYLPLQLPPHDPALSWDQLHRLHRALGHCLHAPPEDPQIRYATNYDSKQHHQVDPRPQKELLGVLVTDNSL